MSSVIHDLSFDSKEERPWQNQPLRHGCIVGHTTTVSTRIWVHVHHAATYTIVLHTKPLKGACFENNQWLDEQGMVFVPTVVKDLLIKDESQLTGVFDIESKDYEEPILHPDTRYYYGIRLDDEWVLGVEKNPSFKSLSEDGDLKFAFYSCHMPFKKMGFFEGVGVTSSIENWSNMSDVLTRQNADFVIGGGDQVYTDGDPKISIWSFLNKYKDKVLAEDDEIQKKLMLSWYADIYRGYWGFTSVRSVFSNYPNYMTWDDHEIMDGWGSYEEDSLECILEDGFIETSYEREKNRELMYKMYDAACTSYYNFQHSHNPNTGITLNIIKDNATITDRKWHYDFNAKKCAFFFMDTRGHKSMDNKAPNYEGEVTLLGSQQISDFTDWLAHKDTINSKALFIVSAVPFVQWKQYLMDIGEVMNLNGSRDDVRDEWDHKLNHPERDKILNALFEFSEKNSNRKIFILSGDVHCSANFQLTKKDSDARVYQLTSSAITYAKNMASWLVKKQVAVAGKLSGRDDIHFKRLSPVETRNNFAIISVEDMGHDVNVHFDLYGRAEQDTGTLMFERITM